MTALALLAVGLGLVLAALEWRRLPASYRLARVGATLLAGAALAGLVLQPAAPATISEVTEAARWTDGAGEDRIPAGLPIYAPPGVGRIPPGATRIPDVATLRRLHPRLEKLLVFGDGIEASDFGRLRGVRLVPQPTPAGPPRFGHVEHAREITTGAEWVLEGRVDGPIPAEASVTLESPDGSVTKAALIDGRFRVRTAPLRTSGRFLGKLALRAGEREVSAERVAISVVPPALPRLLVLEAAPSLDTARLKRWLAPLGGALAVRTQIGRQRSRDVALAGVPSDFAELNAEVLRAFDLVLADARALTALSTAEREALRTAVAVEGLGFLLLGNAPDTGALTPWQLAPVADVEPGLTERLVRPRGIERTFPAREPIPALPSEIRLAASQRALLRDSQERALAASVPLGRGQLGVTLLRDTWRWLQASEPSAFAEYWSTLFAAVARRNVIGRWSVEPESGGPPALHQPLVLRWLGPRGSAPPTAFVQSGESAPVRVELADEPGGAGARSGKFWPTTSGWHRLSDGQAGSGADFFVASAGEWRGVQAARRRDATARLALELAPAASSSATPSSSPARGMLAALLISALAFLWIEARWKAVPVRA